MQIHHSKGSRSGQSFVATRTTAKTLAVAAVFSALSITGTAALAQTTASTAMPCNAQGHDAELVFATLTNGNDLAELNEENAELSAKLKEFGLHFVRHSGPQALIGLDTERTSAKKAVNDLIDSGIASAAELNTTACAQDMSTKHPEVGLQKQTFFTD